MFVGYKCAGKRFSRYKKKKERRQRLVLLWANLQMKTSKIPKEKKGVLYFVLFLNIKRRGQLLVGFLVFLEGPEGNSFKLLFKTCWFEIFQLSY